MGLRLGLGLVHVSGLPFGHYMGSGLGLGLVYVFRFRFRVGT